MPEHRLQKTRAAYPEMQRRGSMEDLYAFLDAMPSITPTVIAEVDPATGFARMMRQPVTFEPR